MSLGQTGSCFLNVTVPARGYLCDPHLPQMLLRCHDEAYAPLPYCQLFISGNILPKLKRSVESTCQKAEPHFNTLIKFFGFFFLHFCHCESCSQRTLYLFRCWVQFFVQEEWRDRLCTDFCMQLGLGKTVPSVDRR